MTNPILLDFPDEFRTERLLIRAPKAGDGAEVNAAILESIDELREWMPWAHGPLPSVEDTEANIRAAAVEFQARRDLRLHIYEKESGKFVGSSGLHRINWDVPSFEIGYWVRTSQQGNGYITEAVNGITRFAFKALGALRIEIRCDKNNERSVKVAERAEYTLEATLRHHDRSPMSGELRDTLIFVKFAESLQTNDQ